MVEYKLEDGTACRSCGTEGMPVAIFQGLMPRDPNRVLCQLCAQTGLGNNPHQEITKRELANALNWLLKKLKTPIKSDEQR